MMMDPILEIKDLHVNFNTEGGIVRAADGVNLSILPGETLGLVGESGCGKSVTALSILGLLPMPPGEIKAESVNWKNRDLLKLSRPEKIALRGKEIGIVFQEPLTSFNPVKRIGDQIGEAYAIHHPDASQDECVKLVIQALGHVGIREPERQYYAYPHELSGGMRQRAMIAMALINRPDLIIADEPTTALDVTIQAQILDLMKKLQDENRMAVLMITHNLGIVAEIADRVAVMYAGRIVESAPVSELYKNPLHPYTRGLLESIPNPERKGDLYAIPGSIPDPLELPTGCYFHPRCRQVMDICRDKYPDFKEISTSHCAACWLYK